MTFGEWCFVNSFEEIIYTICKPQKKKRKYPFVFEGTPVFYNAFKKHTHRHEVMLNQPDPKKTNKQKNCTYVLHTIDPKCTLSYSSRH